MSIVLFLVAVTLVTVLMVIPAQTVKRTGMNVGAHPVWMVAHV